MYVEQKMYALGKSTLPISGAEWPRFACKHCCCGLPAVPDCVSLSLSKNSGYHGVAMEWRVIANITIFEVPMQGC